MRSVIPGLLSLAWSICNAQNTLPSDIREIENGLALRIVVEGEPVQRYNIVERMKLLNTPGLSVALAQNGAIIWAAGYGVADAGHASKVDTHTRFQSASLSKPVTAFGVLELVRAKRLDLDRNVNDYLSSWKIPDNEFTRVEKVTIRRLLSHTAGLNVGGFAGYENGTKIPDAIGVLEGRGNSPKLVVETVPGTKYSYSGGGYVVLQKLIEDQTGKPFAQYMQEAVLTPLQMGDSSFEPYPKQHISLAHGFDGKPYKGGWHVYPELAPAGLWSTPTDLMKFCLAMQASLRGDKDAPMPQALAREMLRPSMAPGGRNAYGLGMELRGAGINASFGHGGSNAGFKSEMFYFFGQDLGLVLMTNSDGGRLVRNELARAISNRYQLYLFPQRTIKPAAITETELKALAGKYRHETEPADLIASIDQRRLILRDPHGGKTNTLIATDKDKFIDRYSGEEVAFTRDAGGKIAGLLYNGEDKFTRVAD